MGRHLLPTVQHAKPPPDFCSGAINLQLGVWLLSSNFGGAARAAKVRTGGLAHASGPAPLVVGGRRCAGAGQTGELRRVGVPPVQQTLYCRPILRKSQKMDLAKLTSVVSCRRLLPAKKQNPARGTRGFADWLSLDGGGWGDRGLPPKAP